MNKTNSGIRSFLTKFHFRDISFIGDVGLREFTLFYLNITEREYGLIKHLFLGNFMYECYI